MTQVDANTWSITFDFQEGVLLEYKFTRGNYAWLDVEKAADGNLDIPNRTLLVEADSSGVLIVNSTVANWRDPLVATSYPSDHAIEIPINPEITVTWNQSMPPDTTFTLSSPTDPIPGTFAYDALTSTVTFTPSELLLVDTIYTLEAIYQSDVVGDPQLVPTLFTFTTIETITINTISLPMVLKK